MRLSSSIHRIYSVEVRAQLSAPFTPFFLSSLLFFILIMLLMFSTFTVLLGFYIALNVQASAPQRVALPPPTYTSLAARFQSSIHPTAKSSFAPCFTYDNELCPICFSNAKDMASNVDIRQMEISLHLFRKHQIK
ncbi:hypothetical protein V8G54_012276 [Vigna mungo]|uniref:Uncharacterized protein n=1 Tax=Vigna mungo TaxID=3915 RepID=A0AAQ3NSU1_VIGMU